MIFASPSPVPQMHSHDYLLRLSRVELEGLTLSHLYTFDEPGVLADAGIEPSAGVRAGSTEWQGSVEGRVVSLAWDWIQLADGAMQTLPAVAPRTNVRLLDNQGYDSLPVPETEALWACIARTDWQRQAAEALRNGSAEAPQAAPSWGALKQH